MKPVTIIIKDAPFTDEIEQILQIAEAADIDFKMIEHECDVEAYRFEKIDSPANSVDWSGRDTGGSSQGYQVYRCKVCGDIWGCRYQYDPGTGSDDRWHNFGQVDPATVKRHY